MFVDRPSLLLRVLLSVLIILSLLWVSLVNSRPTPTPVSAEGSALHSAERFVLSPGTGPAPRDHLVFSGADSIMAQSII